MLGHRSAYTCYSGNPARRSPSPKVPRKNDRSQRSPSMMKSIAGNDAAIVSPASKTLRDLPARSSQGKPDSPVENWRDLAKTKQVCTALRTARAMLDEAALAGVGPVAMQDQPVFLEGGELSRQSQGVSGWPGSWGSFFCSPGPLRPASERPPSIDKNLPVRCRSIGKSG